MAGPSDMKAMLRSMFDELATTIDGFSTAGYDTAVEMLAISSVPLSGAVVHDNGCGNGAVSSTILKQFASAGGSPPKIYATDYAPGMVAETRKRLGGAVEASEMDSEALDFPDSYFTHSFTSFVHMACSGPAQITREIYRTLQPGGVALSSIWGSIGWVAIGTEAVRAIQPSAPELRGPLPAQVLQGSWLKGLFVDAGFEEKSVQVRKTTVRNLFAKMSAQARSHHLQSVLAEAASGWSEEDREKLRREFLKRMEPETAQEDGFTNDVWILVATK
ncbi:S-adenosyl-L-methionine-dependent methyltransferase [Xylariales sp. PMI_506]|nr:S-adenosyl-L-methionine-dependent methyltransferase [Xylariales sp. PMI_506]